MSSVFDLTFQKSHARWERRRRRIRRLAAVSFLVVLCAIAAYFATRSKEAPPGITKVQAEPAPVVAAAPPPRPPAPPAPEASAPRALALPVPPPPAPVSQPPALVAAPAPTHPPPVAVRAPAPPPTPPAAVRAPAPSPTPEAPAPRTPPPAPAVAAVPAPPPKPAPGPPPTAIAAAKPTVDLDKASLRGDRLVAPSSEGDAVLTLVPRVQSHVAELLKRYGVPHGAFAAVDPLTGRVLALASFSASDPKARPFATRAVAPAASIFKLVTAGALLDQSALDPARPFCFRGGKRRLYQYNLVDSAGDHRCANLSRAVAWSLNAPIAKMALKHLTPTALVGAAEELGFNVKLPFELDLEASSARIPGDMVGFGRAAAGFGDVRLSALHGALLSAAVANGGQLLKPFIVEEVRDARGEIIRRAEPEVLSIGFSTPTARRVANMMLLATTEGTGRRHLGRGRAKHLGEIRVPGKTGSLATHNPFMDFSWFVGYAPADDPKIAFAAVVGNKALWHIKSGYVAIEGLRKFFKVENGKHRPTRAARARSRRHHGG